MSKVVKKEKKEKDVKDALQVITVNMFKQHIAIIEKLVYDYQLFPSRSELVRYCLTKAIPMVLDELVKIQSYVVDNDVKSVVKFLSERGWVIRQRCGITDKPKLKLDMEAVSKLMTDTGIHDLDYITKNGIKVLRKLD